MIVYKKPSWLRMFFTVKGSILSHIMGRLVVTTLFAIVLTLLFDFNVLSGKDLSITTLPLTLTGTALAIFLGFRNNSSYDRFWEGRKLWGAMINNTRTLTRQVLTLVRSSEHEGKVKEYQHEIVHHLIAYLHMFRHHLRDESDYSDCRVYLSAKNYEGLSEDPNAPIGLLHKMGGRFADAWQDGWVDTMHLPVLENTLSTMTDIQGACERIKKTPIPFAYTVLMHRIVGAYCFALPFGIYTTVGDLTPVVVLFVSYAFLGLDAIGDEIEEPFGTEPNDLPLSSFCRMLEREARYRIGEDMPDPLEPIDHVLT